MKVQREVMLDRNEMSLMRWMCGFNLKERKQNMEVRELLGLEPVSLWIRRSRLQWFGIRRLENY